MAFIAESANSLIEELAVITESDLFVTLLTHGFDAVRVNMAVDVLYGRRRAERIPDVEVAAMPPVQCYCSQCGTQRWLTRAEWLSCHDKCVCGHLLRTCGIGHRDDPTAQLYIPPSIALSEDQESEAAFVAA